MSRGPFGHSPRPSFGISELTNGRGREKSCSSGREPSEASGPTEALTRGRRNDPGHVLHLPEHRCPLRSHKKVYIEDDRFDILGCPFWVGLFAFSKGSPWATVHGIGWRQRRDSLAHRRLGRPRRGRWLRKGSCPRPRASGDSRHSY